MSAWTEDDAVMADLRSWLIDRGYVVLSDNYNPATFGNQAVTFSRPVAIRLGKDRDQWAVQVCGSDGQWRWLGDWSSAFGHGRPRSTSAQEEADRLRALLGDIEEHPHAAENE
jgi:hypothetical protein